MLTFQEQLFLGTLWVVVSKSIKFLLPYKAYPVRVTTRLCVDSILLYEKVVKNMFSIKEQHQQQNTVTIRQIYLTLTI